VRRNATSLALALMLTAGCRERPVPVVGEPETIDHSEVHVLPRSANGRDYRITVGVPDSYASQPDARYPVIYVTDGYWDYKLFKSIVGGLVYDKVIPEAIVVGLGYPGDAPDYGRLRRFDLTPVSDGEDDELGTSGHAAEFLDVIAREIIPFVEGRYRVDSSYRVLAGSSLGGLFALYTLFTKPGLFSAYVAPSPATPFARAWLFGYEEAFAKSRQPLAARLFMTVAEKEWPAILDGGKKFDAQLRAHAYPGLVYDFRVIEGERHAGTKPESFNRGLRFAFAPREPSP